MTFAIDPELEDDGTVYAVVEVPGGWVSCRGADPDELLDDFLELLESQRAEAAFLVESSD